MGVIDGLLNSLFVLLLFVLPNPDPEACNNDVGLHDERLYFSLFVDDENGDWNVVGGTAFLVDGVATNAAAAFARFS